MQAVRAIGAIALGTFVVLAGFNNCSQVDFKKSEGVIASQGDPASAGDPPVYNPPPADTEAALKTCAEASAKGQLKETAQKIVFQDSRAESQRAHVCEFGVGDNLSPADSQMRARYEQTRALSLPPGAVICDIEMTSKLQKFRYDDMFFMTFNDRVLASNNKNEMISRLSAANAQFGGMNIPVYMYDWMKLRGGKFNNVVDDYCLGQDQGHAACQWPLTEASGQIKLAFDASLLVHIGLTSPSTNQRFGFIITGDNDPANDCYHQELEFDMNVSYYLTK